MFKSFFDFNEVFKEYCKRTHQVFVMQKSVKIQNANRKTAQTPLGKPHYAEQLVYAYILYGCVRGGVHKSSSKGIRKTTWVDYQIFDATLNSYERGAFDLLTM